jgi:hypothetical protein
MSELKAGFQSLPEEYQSVLRLAQEQHQITVAPLQTLVGGWSGAIVFLVSVTWNESRRVEHCILKLDRNSKTARSDEVTRHNNVIETSTPEFARQHTVELVFDPVELDGASEDKIFISEVLILKGDLTLALSSANLAETESWYELAIDNAQAVRASMLELRAAIRLSRVWKEMGKLDESRKLLSDAYSKLTEGFTTADLKEASTLLTA